MTALGSSVMERINDKLMSWAVDHDGETIAQASRAASLDIVKGHVALMPDAHVGIGATIGSVIPTEGAVIPAAVGVDLGCGMIAVRTDLAAEHLPDDLGPLLSEIERSVPAGVGRGFESAATSRAGTAWVAAHQPPSELSEKQLGKAVKQFGSLGSGNHFVEVCLDETDTVWVVLHSGSRGIGNELAGTHIKRAKADAKAAMTQLPDPDLAYFVEGTPQFDAYIADMLWAQDYALGNREQMMDAVLNQLFRDVGAGHEKHRINCHHNFCARERHGDHDLWITRKGAIRATEGDWGVIPGSMGTRSYVVRGKGNPLSWQSCSHGAGRRMSRSQAKRTFTEESLTEVMGDRTWLAGKATALLDEHPLSYKDIDVVMAAQEDLVQVHAVLRQVLNYKGA